MEHQTSQFESSEMLATFLASTQLPERTWRQCSRANTTAHQRFTVDVVEDAVYVAFSGLQTLECFEETLVELENFSGIFSAFPHHVKGRDEPVMVHSGLLKLFLSFYHNHEFQNKMLQVLNESKSVIFTGHSIGGALASLSALWLLSCAHFTSPVFCITYGSPMLGNQSFSQAILQERWSGNFCHIVAQNDILPRLLLFTPFDADVSTLFHYWHISMTSPYFSKITPIPSQVLGCVDEVRLRGGEKQESTYRPFGSYMFCTEKGAICLDNTKAIVDLCFLTMANGTANSCIEDHLKYEEYIAKICWQYLQKSSECFSESSNEAGIALALQSSGVSHQEPVYGQARSSLVIARHLGCSRNLNNAKMAVELAKITPLRAQIEWYKVYCDNSDDQVGYYDSFKQRGASKRGFKVNVNRIRLAEFWDDVINKLETNKLTHDFHKLPKYVNASQFYKLLVEPLEIAEYYRTCMHKKKGHYMGHGREKRFKIFDKWWNERKVGDEENNPRSKYASLTQDSCFWARVEEARAFIYEVMGEVNLGRHLALLDKIEKFEKYASRMVEKKEVSTDVLAENSGYSMFRKEWRDLKSQMNQLSVSPQFPGFQDGMVQLPPFCDNQ